MAGKPAARAGFVEALAFAATLGWAIASGLQPADLVWGLWISSLTSGWLLLVLTFATSIFFPAAVDATTVGGAVRQFLFGLRSVLLAGLLAAVFFPVERYAFAHVRSRRSSE